MRHSIRLTTRVLCSVRQLLHPRAFTWSAFVRSKAPDVIPAPAADFHAVADRTLAYLESALCAALEADVPDFDCVQSMGVLTLSLGGRGTYVINKQAPNQQLWWSSPLSGPIRFRLIFDDSGSSAPQWVSTRRGEALETLLAQEIKVLTGVEIDLTGAARASH